jgi:hypothetical protein
MYRAAGTNKGRVDWFPPNFDNAIFCPKCFSLGFEFETIYGKICKKMNNPRKISCHILAKLAK